MYLVAALKILYNSKFVHKRAATKHTQLPKLMEIQTPSREPHVIHTVLVPIISIVSNKRISWYNTHDIHKLLYVSAPRCYPQEVTATKAHRTICYNILFILIGTIKHWIVKIHKIDSNIVYSFMY
jgi:hypothetical protein